MNLQRYTILFWKHQKNASNGKFLGGLLRIENECCRTEVKISDVYHLVILVYLERPGFELYPRGRTPPFPLILIETRALHSWTVTVSTVYYNHV